ncbi:CotH kinase family protein [Marinoscillum sp. MHG1-6]|uniref:CotH kinase family protein n=1 Tax=Marinoscillum sp. MHG1-6 TaxID=2959627 RepID=UPI0021587AAC|nr:CotH kinase family protein [Marinoscillum sp. MHG1-6]
MRKSFLLIFFITCLLYGGYTQTINWESIFYHDDEFRYLTNNDLAPASNWREVSYDDSAWSLGIGGFGYGDGDDSTELNNILSVFLRKEFTVIDKNEIEKLILHIDYDDAFVAFINGAEIARSPGLNDQYPASGTLSTSQHEALMPTGGSPEAFSIDPANLIISGTNVITVQVHNVDPTSSDLSSNVWLTAGLNTEISRYKPTPEWFFPPVELSELVSNLPILVIETNGQTILNDPKIAAQMGIIYNGPGMTNSISDSFNEYDGAIGIELRGNSTQTFPKKPYLIETRDLLGQNLNIGLLGMPPENDWILRASYLDHTFIRNSLADHLSRQTGRWASRVRHVEVVLNGEYQGIYLLMEKIKWDKNRLDIDKLYPYEISGEELTGGYIWEVTGFGNDFGEARRLKYPGIDVITNEQLNYIRTIDDSFRYTMTQGSYVYANPNSGYVQHIDVLSFVDEMLVQEAMRNCDAYGWSGYFHKDKNGPIKAGPVWDFDQAAGNSTYPDNGVVGLWMAQHPDTWNTPFFWSLLLNDPFFRYSLKLRWEELRKKAFSDENIFHFVDSIASELSEAQVREFEKWPVLGANIWRESAGYQSRDTYQKEVDYLKSFIQARCQWLDNALSYLTKPSGYPQIIPVPSDTIKVNIADGRIDVNVRSYFRYPYSSNLQYSLGDSLPNFALFKMFDPITLRIQPLNFGIGHFTITCKDVYGNKMDNTLIVEIGDFDEVGNEDLLSNDVCCEDRVSIYPNPANKEITFQLDDESSRILNGRIYDMSGQLISSIDAPKENNSQAHYNCESLKGGLYFVELTLISGERLWSKFLVD